MRVISFTPTDKGKVAANRKESRFAEEYAAIVTVNDLLLPRIETPVILRLYKATDGAIRYACVWIRDHNGDRYSSGGANAKGYGYHFASEAAYFAFENAGIKFDDKFGGWAGTGDTAILEAVKATAEFLHPGSPVHIHHAHP